MLVQTQAGRRTIPVVTGVRGGGGGAGRLNAVEPFSKRKKGKKKKGQMMTKPEGSYISAWTHNGAANTMRNNGRMQEEKVAAEAASWRSS